MKRIRSLVLVPLLAIVLSGCTATQDQIAAKTIVSANGLQDAAARAYQDAVAKEKAAGQLCSLALCPSGIPSLLNPVGCPLPAPTSALLAACTAAGTPIPYDPTKLAALAGPVNAGYEAVRGAEAARLAVKAGKDPNGLGDALALMGQAVLRVYVGASDLGIKLPLADALKLAQEVSK